MRIEKPDWATMIRFFPDYSVDETDLDMWFTKNIEPINKMLAEGVEVKLEEIGGTLFLYNGEGNGHSHTGFLINVKRNEPPKPEETAEDIVKQLIEMDESGSFTGISQLIVKAKAVLGD